MKKYSLMFLAAIMLAAAASTASAATYVEVTLAPLSRSHRPPPLGRRQGWLTISNRDWQSYTVVANKGKIYIYRDSSHRRGGVVIPSGTSRTIALERDTYDVYGSHSDKMRVRIHEGRTSTISLEPFGRRGHSGLRGVITDGGKGRRGTLFDAYSSKPSQHRPGPQPKPQPGKNTPPPPPVIINRPPVVNHQPSKPGPGGPGHNSGKPGKPGNQDKWGPVYGGR